MNSINYDASSIESILEHANRLTGKSLAEAVQLPENIVNQKNKGNLGQLVEEFYFGLKVNSLSAPDFKHAGLELKTTGVEKAKKKAFKVKERLVLSMIDYGKIAEEEWHDSTFLRKCRRLLIMFYLFEKETPVIHRKFILDPLLYEIPEEDLAIIKSDWEKIRKFVLDGRAHELSEGETFFLAASRKGSGGSNESMRTQPFSSERAKSRSFAFKQGYVSKLLDRKGNSRNDVEIAHAIPFEKLLKDSFSSFAGKTVAEIGQELGIEYKGKNHKVYWRQLSNAIIDRNVQVKSQISQAGILVKTVRTDSRGKPNESMSFRSFDFFEIQNQDWEISDFASDIEQKFLFVVFETDDSGVERLEKFGYWHMPHSDREEVKRVWLETQRRINSEIERLPGISENRVAHVRPHGRNAKDRKLSPSGEMWMRQSFWLNASYIEEVIKNL